MRKKFLAVLLTGAVAASMTACGSTASTTTSTAAKETAAESKTEATTKAATEATTKAATEATTKAATEATTKATTEAATEAESQSEEETLLKPVNRGPQKEEESSSEEESSEAIGKVQGGVKPAKEEESTEEASSEEESSSPSIGKVQAGVGPQISATAEEESSEETSSEEESSSPSIGKVQAGVGPVKNEEKSSEEASSEEESSEAIGKVQGGVKPAKEEESTEEASSEEESSEAIGKVQGGVKPAKEEESTEEDTSEEESSSPSIGKVQAGVGPQISATTEEEESSEEASSEEESSEEESSVSIGKVQGGVGPVKTDEEESSEEASSEEESSEEETEEAKKTADGKGFKIGMVTDVGGVNDGSFNQSAWEGLQRAEEDFGCEVKYLESHTDADYAPNIETFIDEDYDLIVITGYMLADALHDAAELYPDQKFVIIDDTSNADLENVNCLMFEQAQASYLVGLAAGYTTESDTVGFVLGMESETMNQFGYGYCAGVLDANSDAKILQYNANSFGDTASGKNAAVSMITNGADVIFHAAGGTGLGVIDACKENKVWAIGVDSDQSSIAPETILTSAMKRVDNACYDAAYNIITDNFTPGVTTYDLSMGGVDIAPTTDNLSEEVLEKIEEAKKKIIAGEIVVPKEKDEFEKVYGDVYELDD